MYDYVTREFDLTPEEQEKARAILLLLERSHRAVMHGGNGYNAGEGQALRTFKDQFYNEVFQRLGQPDELRGGWNISEDCTKVIICQVKWVGDMGSK